MIYILTGDGRTPTTQDHLDCDYEWVRNIRPVSAARNECIRRGLADGRSKIWILDDDITGIYRRDYVENKDGWWDRTPEGWVKTTTRKKNGSLVEFKIDLSRVETFDYAYCSPLAFGLIRMRDPWTHSRSLSIIQMMCIDLDQIGDIRFRDDIVEDFYFGVELNKKGLKTGKLHDFGFKTSFKKTEFGNDKMVELFKNTYDILDPEYKKILKKRVKGNPQFKEEHIEQLYRYMDGGIILDSGLRFGARV